VLHDILAGFTPLIDAHLDRGGRADGRLPWSEIRPAGFVG
jgi:hypothetical protein